MFNLSTWALVSWPILVLFLVGCQTEQMPEENSIIYIENLQIGETVKVVHRDGAIHGVTGLKVIETNISSELAVDIVHSDNRPSINLPFFVTSSNWSQTQNGFEVYLNVDGSYNIRFSNELFDWNADVFQPEWDSDREIWTLVRK